MNRNIGLLRAISTRAPFPGSSYCIGGFGPVRGGHNGQLFWRGTEAPRFAFEGASPPRSGFQVRVYEDERRRGNPTAAAKIFFSSHGRSSPAIPGGRRPADRAPAPDLTERRTGSGWRAIAGAWGSTAGDQH